MAGTLAHSGLLRAKSRKAPLFFELIKHVFRIRSLAVELDDLERSLFGGQIGDIRAEVLDALFHPLGEEELDFKFLPAGGQFHLRGSDEALTAYGGLVAWDHFLELAYRRLQEWLSQTAPQLSLTMEKPPPWAALFATSSRSGSRHFNQLEPFILFPTADFRLMDVTLEPCSRGMPPLTRNIFFFPFPIRVFPLFVDEAARPEPIHSCPIPCHPLIAANRSS